MIFSVPRTFSGSRAKPSDWLEKEMEMEMQMMELCLGEVAYNNYYYCGELRN